MLRIWICIRIATSGLLLKLLDYHNDPDRTRQTV